MLLLLITAALLHVSFCQFAFDGGEVANTTYSVFYVVLEEGDPCPANSTSHCHKLSYFTKFPGVFFTSNTLFYFLDGNHSFVENKLLEINGVNDLTLQGLGTMEQDFDSNKPRSSVAIICEGNSGGIAFLDSTNVTVAGITYSSCGGRAFPSLSPLLQDPVGIPNTTLRTNATLAFVNVRGLLIANVSVLNGSGYGLLCINCFDTVVDYSLFSGNNLITRNFSPLHCLATKCQGGNAFFLYLEPVECNIMRKVYSLTFMASKFSFGLQTNFLFFPLVTSAGLGIVMLQGTSYGIDVSIENSVIDSNIAFHAPNMWFAVATGVLYYTLRINNTNFINGTTQMVAENGLFQESLLPQGSGLVLFLGMPIPGIFYQCNFTWNMIPSLPIYVASSSFTDNTAFHGSGVGIGSLLTNNVHSSPQRIVFESCEISRNRGYAGAALLVSETEILANSPFQYEFINLTIVANEAFPYKDLTGILGLTPYAACAIALQQVVATFIDVKLLDNDCTGLQVFSSFVTFKGQENRFIRNKGVTGGGMQLEGESSLILTPFLHIHFEGNYASQRGGAIYLSKVPSYYPYCFYQVLDPDQLPDPNIVIDFIANEAKDAGDAIYGTVLDECFLFLSSDLATNGILFTLISADETLYYQIFDYSHQTGISVVASDPTKVCFCINAAPNCTIDLVIASAFPGQVLTFSLASVGEDDGVSPGVVIINQTGQDVSLFSTSSQCSEVVLTVTTQGAQYSNGTLLQEIKLIVDSGVEDLFLARPAVVLIEVYECPVGFQLASQSGVCDCDPLITNAVMNITCNINTEDFNKVGDASWVSYYNESDCIIAKGSCPFDYCVSGSVTFKMNSTDLQCAYNRSGILCGQCQEGLSLMLGSNQCGACNNNYLALIIVFALAGIGLVAFLIALNLTVTVGTINGVIFFTNVVKISESIFFAEGPIYVLSQFIAWLNLDFGISICFFDGMDGFYKTFLQFIFPFYIWIVVGVVILLCRWYSRVARLLGTHIVSVLATLLLLSYTKLFATVILALRQVPLSCGMNVSLSLWYSDPNMVFFQGKHISVALVAIIVLVGLAIPYTLCLTFIPLIEGPLSKYKCFKWTAQLKPLFDAYCAPFNDNFRFWTGLLLISRLVLVLIVSSTTDPDSIRVSIIVTVTFLISILFLGKSIYKIQGLNVLEYWFLLLLLLMTVGNFTVHSRVVLHLVLSASFVTFLCIISYHMYLCLGLNIKIKRYFLLLKKQNYDFHHAAPIVLPNMNDNKDKNDSISHTVVSVSEVRRESLFDSEVYVSEDARKKVTVIRTTTV